MSDDGRPTFWIVLSAVLLLAVVGLGVWVAIERNRANDAEAQLAQQKAALAQAQQRSTAADKARKTLDDALNRAKEEIQRLGDAGSAAKACLQRAIDAIDDAFSSGSITRAVQRLQDLVGECRSAAT